MGGPQSRREIIIGQRRIGTGLPAYIIAEIGFNHGGDLGLALDMIAAAAAAGVDAVKFQTFRANRLTLESSPHFSVIKSGELGEAEHRQLAEAARAHGVDFLSTPFCTDSASMLDGIGVPAFKVASMDVDDLPLLRHIAGLGKPILLSTGMSTLAEIGDAVAAIRQAGNEDIVLLHCMSLYPTPLDAAHLRGLVPLAEAFGLPVGYSDHVLGNAAALAAATLGAVVIEKHFTSDRSLPGPDHAMSADTAEMAALVRAIREAEMALGRACLDATRPDRAHAEAFRRSIYASCAIPKGATITAAMLKYVRPGGGLSPALADRVIGAVARTEIAADTAIRPDLLEARGPLDV